MAARLAACALLTAPGLIAAGPVAGHYFEPANPSASHFIGRGFGPAVELSAGSVRIAGPDAAKTLHFRLEGGSAAAVLAGEEPLPSHSYYFIGNDPAKWRTNVSHFARVRVRNAYPGTDLVYYAGPRGLEFDFSLTPRATIGRLRLRFDRPIAVDASGALRAAGSGELLLDAPRAYELDGTGGRHWVPSRFRLLSNRVVSFAVERSDPSRTLVIDPTLVYATFLGGSGLDTVVAAEHGPDGGLYVAGHTTSIDLPQAVSLNSILNRPEYLSATDAFVARYTPDGSALVYVVYVGGTAADTVTSLAVDPQGRATVTGYTYSYNFPTTSGAYQGSLGASYDGYCFRLSADGGALEYSTFLGIISPAGAGLINYNRAPLLTGVDAQGTAIVAGTNYVFGTTVAGVVQPTPGVLQQKEPGGIDGFLLRLNNSGTALLYATWFGGSKDDYINALIVDDLGNAYLGGSTQSVDLPVVHAWQTAPPAGGTSGFFAKITPDGRSLLEGSYYGGQGASSSIASIALDSAGGIYLAGTSPVAAAPGLTEVPGEPPSVVNPPGFLLKLDPSAQSPQYAWAYSVLGLKNIVRIRVDRSARPCILGSISAKRVTAGALFGGFYDTTGLTCLEADGKTIRYATLVGNAAADFALDNGGNPVVVASISTVPPRSTFSPVTTANAPQPLPGGSDEGYIFKIIADNPQPQLYFVSPSLLTTPTSSGLAFTDFLVSGTNFAVGAQVLWNGQPLSSLPQSGVMDINGSTVIFRLSNSALMQQPRGDQQLTVSLPAPGGGVSNALTVKYLNPPPGGLVVSPAVVPAGSGDQTFKVTGNFTSDCQVTWDGQPIATALLSVPQSSLQITVPASALAQPGDHVIAVTNPPPGGGVATVHVAVTTTGLPANMPVITGAVIVGVREAGVMQTLTATGYSSNDVTVVWNGNDRPTSASFGTVQFVLSLADVSQMGSAQVQIRSGGVLSPAVTAYIGVRIAAGSVTPDPSRGRAYLLTANSGKLPSASLVSVAIPSGTLLQTVDLGSPGNVLTMTDDGRFLYVSTIDGRIRRLNLETFVFDTTITLPSGTGNGTLGTLGYPLTVPVAGSSDTIVAAGIDGIVGIFDDGVPRQNTSAGLMTDPRLLTLSAGVRGFEPVFATPDVVWASIFGTFCMVRLHYDTTGFTSSLEQSCTETDGLVVPGLQGGPWGLPADEVRLDSGAAWFQYGPRTLVWKSPRAGTLDVASRRIFSSVTDPFDPRLSTLAIYSLDTEELLASVPQSGFLPYGNPVPYGETQVLWGNSTVLLLIDLP